MRAYTVATVAVTLNVPAKWIDNTLSHHSIPGVRQSRQGVARRLAPEAVLVLEIGLLLARALAVPLRRALELAVGCLAEDGTTATIVLSPECALRLDIGAMRASLASRLADAVEIAPLPRRGRPPRT